MDWIFDENISFEKRALRLFQKQSKDCQVYSEYLNLLNINPTDINAIDKIPFLPVEFFKTRIVTTTKENPDAIFSSSGTTGQVTSKHHVNDISIYKKSFMDGFQHFYEDIKGYRVLALLPSYLEREGSSLVYMCDHLIKESQHPESGFYLNNLEELKTVLQKKSNHKTLLIGVSYALLDLAQMGQIHLENTIVMETGGMKGKRKEMIRSELHQILKTAFKLKEIHSEYGMTELLSQAYSKGKGIFETPHWMKVIIRDSSDPFQLISHQKTGGINIIDLANIHSCAFIATQDLGKSYPYNKFEVLGRFEQSEMRGCNLMVQ